MQTSLQHNSWRHQAVLQAVLPTKKITAGSTKRWYRLWYPVVLRNLVRIEGPSNCANLYFFNSFRTLASAIESVLWNESAQMWFDFDLLNNKQRQFFYPSNLFPLWAECYDQTKKEQVRAKYINVPEVKYTSFFVGLPSLAEPTDRWPSLKVACTIFLSLYGKYISCRI